MIIISLASKTYFQLKKEVMRALKYAELIEVRVDALDEFDVNLLAKINHAFSPLLTLRSKEEGGYSSLSSEDREKRLKSLIDLKPAYIDLEYERDLKLLPYLKKQSPKTKWICSYHDLCYFPKNVEELIKKMREHRPWKVKIAAMASSTLEALKMLELMKKHSHFIGIAMGEKGSLSRILGPVFKQPITYGCLDERQVIACGQFSGKELEEVYHYSQLNVQTKLLGLLGSPLKQSPGYRVYNSVFHHEKIKAVYVNIELGPDELKEGVRLLQQLGFLGCSVTIPHKRAVLSYVTEMERSQKGIGSINSLLFSKKKIKGKNTDGLAAKLCLEAKGPLKQKKVLILGAGGTAAGIGYVLQQAKAKVSIMNRTNSKAFELAKELGCEFKPFEMLSFLKSEDYDILVHTTSVGTSQPQECLVPKEVIYPHKIVLDVVFQNTQLLKWAREKRCQVINGYDFWLSQASEQFVFWFKEIWPRVIKLMRRYLP